MSDQQVPADERREEFYRDVIEPGVRGLAATCRRENVHAFFAYEKEDGQFAYTMVGNEDDSEKLRIFKLINDAWSIDELIKRLIEDARKNGHDSKFLTAVGIPAEPEEKISIPTKKDEVI